VKKLVKNVHYLTPFFFTEKVSEKLKSFSALFGLFEIFHLTANNSTEGAAKKFPV
jgi:membrane-associated protease RseP (regulator of RpoE activity)